MKQLLDTKILTMTGVVHGRRVIVLLASLEDGENLIRQDGVFRRHL